MSVSATASLANEELGASSGPRHVSHRRSSQPTEEATSTFGWGAKGLAPGSTSVLIADPRSTTYRMRWRLLLPFLSAPLPTQSSQVRRSRSTKSECIRGYPCRRASNIWRKSQGDIQPLDLADAPRTRPTLGSGNAGLNRAEEPADHGFFAWLAVSFVAANDHPLQ